MKRVVVLRAGERQDLGTGLWGWEIPARLTDYGRAQCQTAVQTRRELLKDYDAFVTSPLISAQETLYAMMAELGYGVADLYGRVIFCDGLRASGPSRYMRNNPNETMGEWIAKNKEFVLEEGERVYVDTILSEVLRKTVKSALCISHVGLIDCLLVYIKRELGHDNVVEETRGLGNCEGFLVDFDGNVPLKVEELRFPV